MASESISWNTVTPADLKSLLRDKDLIIERQERKISALSADLEELKRRLAWDRDGMREWQDKLKGSRRLAQGLVDCLREVVHNQVFEGLNMAL